ncbi:MAG TPA: CDP-alcohol phosphatidyltransferase family protein [Gemmatimonadales bacterium]
METAKREMTFLLAVPERKLLHWMAARLPRAMRPNHLTLIGVAGSVGVAVGYYLATRHPAWLWLSSGMLLVNWFGDSLDGTLARVRKVERPKYGYYIDHMVDAFTTAAIGSGVGLSPYVSLDLALVLVVIYLALSINIYLESSVFGVFEISYGIFGPTEVRLLLILANTVLVGAGTWFGVAPTAVARVADWAVAGLCVVMCATLAIRFGKNLTRLARLEPQRRD